MFIKPTRIIFIILLSSAILLLFLSLPRSGLAQLPGVPPGLYLALALKAPYTPSFTPTHTTTPTYGILLISEAMVHPAGAEPEDEWIELYNTGGATIDLSTYKLGDEEIRGQGEGMLQFPIGASLAPGQVIIIANKAASFRAVYGFNPDYEMIASNPTVPDMRKYSAWASGNVSLDNSGDDVLVLDGVDSVVDSLSWGDSSWAFYPPCPAPGFGWTLERYPAHIDTDTASDWRKQPVPAPGVVDLTPPTSTPTQTPTQTPTRTPSPSLTASLTYTRTLKPTRTPTTTSSQTAVHTFTPTPTDTHTQTPTSTTLLTPTETTGPFSTPTPTVTPTPEITPTGGWLLISEVLYNPVGVEPDNEWIELYNAGDTAIDLTNYKVGGTQKTPGGTEGMYQFPINTTIASRQVIIIANRADVFTNSYGFYPDYELIDSDSSVPNMSVYSDWAYWLVKLSNIRDEVLVLDENDQFVDAVSWGNSGWAFDPDCPVVAEGHSIERNPANVDTDTAADWIDQALPNPKQVNISYQK